MRMDWYDINEWHCFSCLTTTRTAWWTRRRARACCAAWASTPRTSGWQSWWVETTGYVSRVTPRVMWGEPGRGGHHPPLPLLQRVPEPRVPQAEGGARPSLAPSIIHVSGHHCVITWTPNSSPILTSMYIDINTSPIRGLLRSANILKFMKIQIMWIDYQM